MKRMSRTGSQGFSMIETAVGFSLVLLAAAGFITMAAAERRRFSLEMELRESFRRAQELALSGKGADTGEILRFSFTLEGEERKTKEEFAVRSADVPWTEGQISVEFYEHE